MNLALALGRRGQVRVGVLELRLLLEAPGAYHLKLRQQQSMQPYHWRLQILHQELRGVSLLDALANILVKPSHEAASA